MGQFVGHAYHADHADHALHAIHAAQAFHAYHANQAYQKLDQYHMPIHEGLGAMHHPLCNCIIAISLYKFAAPESGEYQSAIYSQCSTVNRMR